MQVTRRVLFQVLYLNLRSRVFSFRPSFARTPHPDTPKSSGRPPRSTCPRCANSRSKGDAGDMDGVNSSGFADQSVTNRSWADQIQDAHYALRLDMLQVISSFHVAQLTVHLYRTYFCDNAHYCISSDKGNTNSTNRGSALISTIATETGRVELGNIYCSTSDSPGKPPNSTRVPTPRSYPW